MIRVSKSICGGILFFCVALYAFLAAPNHSAMAYTIPTVYSVLLMILGGVQIISGVRSIIKKDEMDILALNFSLGRDSQLLRVIIFAVFMFLYAILIPTIGFVVSTSLFLVAADWYLGVRKIKNYIISLMIFGGMFMVFQQLLHVRFPHGILY